jgi:hypothetical protein
MYECRGGFWDPQSKNRRAFAGRGVRSRRGGSGFIIPLALCQELHRNLGTFIAAIMFRVALVALMAALVNATTPDNVSSRLMIHVSLIEKGRDNYFLA